MVFQRRPDAERRKAAAANDNGPVPASAKNGAKNGSEDDADIDLRILSIATLLGKQAARECLTKAANDNEQQD